jgi:hypothetical protein
MRLGVHGSVQGARPTVCYILLCAQLSSSALPKQVLSVSRHQEEHANVSPMAVAPSSKHFAGVRKVWVGTSWRPKLGFSPPAASQTRCLGRAAPQLARIEVPARMITIPAKCLRHDVSKTLLAAGRPLRRGRCTNVYLNDVRSAGSASDRVSLVPCSIAYGSRPLREAVAPPTRASNKT